MPEPVASSGRAPLHGDLRAYSEVRPIQQANDTDELAEVTFDQVSVPREQIVGQLDGDWKVAMHILAHERGTNGWFRRSLLNRQLADRARFGTPATDALLGDALLDLAAVADRTCTTSTIRS